MTCVRHLTGDANREQVLQVGTQCVLNVIKMNCQITKTRQTAVTHLQHHMLLLRQQKLTGHNS